MKTVYALRSLQYLAEKYETGPVLISEISANEKIPKKFLETILLTLKNEGILTSKVGKGGGYRLAAAPNEITLASVVKTLEGGIALLPCAEPDTPEHRCDHCSDAEACGTMIVMSEISEKLAESLQKKTVADLAEEAEKVRQRTSGSIDYFI